LSCLDPCSTAKVKHGSRRECQILEPLEKFTAHAAAQHVGPGIKRGSSGKRPLQGTAVEQVRKLGQRALFQDLSQLRRRCGDSTARTVKKRTATAQEDAL
jgi:hypothetical protein